MSSSLDISLFSSYNPLKTYNSLITPENVIYWAKIPTLSLTSSHYESFIALWSQDDATLCTIWYRLTEMASLTVEQFVQMYNLTSLSFNSFLMGNIRSERAQSTPAGPLFYMVNPYRKAIVSWLLSAWGYDFPNKIFNGIKPLAKKITSSALSPHATPFLSRSLSPSPLAYSSPKSPSPLSQSSSFSSPPKSLSPPFFVTPNDAEDEVSTMIDSYQLYIINRRTGIIYETKDRKYKTYEETVKEIADKRIAGGYYWLAIRSKNISISEKSFEQYLSENFLPYQSFDQYLQSISTKG